MREVKIKEGEKGKGRKGKIKRVDELIKKG